MNSIDNARNAAREYLLDCGYYRHATISNTDAQGAAWAYLQSLAQDGDLHYLSEIRCEAMYSGLLKWTTLIIRAGRTHGPTDIAALATHEMDCIGTYLAPEIDALVSGLPTWDELTIDDYEEGAA